jgi:PhnB protein
VTLLFPGTCEQAFRFYQSVFGGELTMLQRYKEMREHGYEVAPEDEEKIAFVMLPVNEQFLLPGDDVLPSAGECVQGNNFLLGVSVDSRGEVDRLYAALSEGGMDKTPPAYYYWGDYFALFRDRFGVWWNVNCHDPEASR